jgi:small-conductance mechanosensitive channel
MSTSFAQFWVNIFDSAERWLNQNGQRILVMLLVFIFFYLVAQLFRLYSQRTLDINLYKRPTPEALALYNGARRKIFVGRALWLFFIIVAWTTSLSISGLPVSNILGGLGFLGLGLSFALSDLIQQYFSGFLILTQRHINVGEQITIGSVSGVVKSIEARYTIIQDFSQGDVLVSNSDILRKNLRISPVTGEERSVIRMRVSLDSDPSTTITLGEQVLGGIEGINQKEPPKGYLRYFGDSLQFAFYYTGPAARRERFIVRSAAMIALLKAFKEKGIKIDYPSGIQTEEPEED